LNLRPLLQYVAVMKTALRVMSPPGLPSLSLLEIWLPHPAKNCFAQKDDIYLTNSIKILINIGSRISKILTRDQTKYYWSCNICRNKSDMKMYAGGGIRTHEPLEDEVTQSSQ
jgi:hypothetical protein